MPSTLPDGDRVPEDGSLPDSALATLGERPFGVYVHVPFCATRCGYCDFNTYTAAELGPGASRDGYADTVAAELDLAARVLRSDRPGGPPPVSTVFFGGGTPTLLPDGALPAVLERIDATFGLAPDAEVTTEANPDSVDARSLAVLREGGVNRVSFGVQSAVAQVLATLDRTHDASRVPDVVAAARAAGFEQVSVDLIYGTPGESMADWQASLDFAVRLAPEHVSAYALIVERGTALARAVARGEIAAPDDDEMADKYIAAEETLSAGGFGWYELSNWARTPAARCRHNELYWTGGDWWGAGPGAHSHIGGVRWWNVKHP
ncbi:MAG: radical SAM family heme chaperone HemW, partial [Nocardioidaceae bacterium]